MLFIFYTKQNNFVLWFKNLKNPDDLLKWVFGLKFLFVQIVLLKLLFYLLIFLFILGMANMAICNLIGSNIFDILFCLGVPWFIKTFFFSPTASLVINSSALTYTTTTLLSTLVLLFITFSVSGWKLNWKVGLMCFIFYLGFLLIACMFELNMFGNMNPPPCEF